MQFVVAFSCLLAVASAGYLNSPVVGPAVAYGAYGVYNDGSYKGEGLYESLSKGEGLIESQDLARVAVAAPIAYAANAYAANTYAAHTYAAPAIAHTYAAAPVIARASHAVAYKAPLVSAPHPVPVHTYAAPYAYATPVAHAYSAPLAHTYGAHTYAAHSYAAPIAHGYAGLASEARLVDPIAIAAGAPLPTGDTVEVAAAKASHYAAHAAAKGHFIAKRSPGYLGATAYASPLAYSGYTGYAAPLTQSYGYSGYAAPYSYGHGYGRLGSFYG